MNPVHLHLVLNHLPVVGAWFTLVLLVVALLKRSEELKRTSLLFAVFVALVALPAYLTGEPAEEAAEKLPGIPEALLERHEEAAQWALTAQLCLGLFALLGLAIFRRGKPVSNRFAGVLLVLMIGAGGLLGWTANLGGQLRHPEIRAHQPATTAATEPGGP